MRVIRPLAVDDGNLASTNVPTAYAAYSALTTFALGERTRDAGDMIEYESAQAGNTGHALTDPSWWIEVGPSNRLRMFDQSNTSQTTNPNSIDTVVNASGRVDSVALMNVSATAVRIISSTVADGVLYDETFSLVSDSGITDWYGYFFEVIDRQGDLVITGLPLYANPTIEVIITEAGETVALGTLVLGQSRELGSTVYGAQLSIQDYSRKTADAFGVLSITERAFSKRADFKVTVVPSLVDVITALLAQYRATPILYQGTDDYAGTWIYGFYKDFTVEISYPTLSYCTLQIEGLT